MLIARDFAVALSVVWIVIDANVVFRLKTGKEENRDRSSFVVVQVCNLVAWIGGIALSFTMSGSMRSPLLQIVGLVVMACGIAIRFTAIAQLGRFHTPNVAVREDHRLIETGLYAHVRHPSYLGALIAFLGLGFGLGNWLSLAVILILSLFAYLYRIREEEAALTASLGEPYRAYCRRVKRLIPGVY